ncbi:MAG: LemA family protein [Patescibacteria group bacterium]
MNGVLVLIVVLGVIGLFVAGTYNSLISWRNRVKTTFSQIDVQLKRRHDLIPNLIETVKGYATHEKELLENVTKARVSAINAESISDKVEAENMLSGTLKTLFAVSENYPELKANQNFLELQRDLRDTEDKISASRQLFNTTVLGYNTKVQSFPANLIAKMFGFSEEKFFEITEESEREVPKVQF